MAPLLKMMHLYVSAALHCEPNNARAALDVLILIK